MYLLTDVYVGYRFADAQMFQEELAASAKPAQDADKISEDAL
jgi:hypothetical protein